MKRIYPIAIVLTIAGLMISSTAALPLLGENTNQLPEKKPHFNVEYQDVEWESGPLEGTPLNTFHSTHTNPKGNPCFTGPGDQIHPTLVQSESGILSAVYYDTYLENCSWAVSNDYGNTWTHVFTDNYSYDYPSSKLWAQDRGYTTARPDPLPIWGYGGMILLAMVPDLHDPYTMFSWGWTWNVTNPEYNYGFHSMTDVDIACDDGQGYDEYGLITAVMSKTNDVEDLTNIPFMQYAQKDNFPRVWGSWRSQYEGCLHTDVAIDPIKRDGVNYQWMYGVYDWFDTAESLWKILIRTRDFTYLSSGSDIVVTGLGNLQYPAVAVNDHNLVILAETDENGNKDIICFYSDSGWQNLQSSFVTTEIADELYPDIRHVKDLEFVCTFISENTLYMSTTTDGGATWSTPEAIESNVVEEYKATDLCMDAMHTLYEIDNSSDIDLWMTTHKDQIELPTWAIGDTWTYNTHLYSAASPNVTDDMVMDLTGELLMEVTDDTGDIYTLTVSIQPLTGDIYVPGVLGFKLTRFNSYEGILKIHKTNLSAIEHESMIKAIVLIQLGPITLPIPIQMQYRLRTRFDPFWKLLPFPLYDGKSGGYQHITMHQDFDIGMFWGIIPISNGNSSEGWVGDSPYTCDLESIIVPAGTYDAYNITCNLIVEDVLDWYSSYYCPDVGNVVKCGYNIDAVTGNTFYLYEMELISTTYTP
jgi:hypothetical protein